MSEPQHIILSNILNKIIISKCLCFLEFSARTEPMRTVSYDYRHVSYIAAYQRVELMLDGPEILIEVEITEIY